MKPTPPEWPRCTSGLVYADAAAAITWLCNAFSFAVRLRVDDDAGKVAHCELSYGDGVIMIAQQGDDAAPGWRGLLRSPRQAGGRVNQYVMIYVDDADAHCAQARDWGAQIVQEPATQDYGADYWSDRSYGAVDPEGHLWWITQRLRSKA